MSALTIIKTLAEERVCTVGTRTKLPPIHGIVRLIDAKGNTLGVILDKAVLDELEEDLEASNPGFLASLAKSRASGRISGKDIKARLSA